MKNLTKTIGLLSLILTLNAFAQEEDLQREIRAPDSIPSITPNLQSGIVEKVYEGTSNLESVTQARKKIIEEATQKTSEQYVQSLLGEARFKKHRNILNEKVYRQSSRFIPVIKAGDLQNTPEGQKLVVTLQVNTKILESLLQEQGMMNDGESAPMVIPFLSIEDQVHGDNFRWWKAQNPARLQGMEDFLETQLQKTLFSMGIFVQRPEAAQMRLMLPAMAQQDILTQEQIQSLATRWNIPLTLTGDLSIHKDLNGEVLLELRLAVNQVSSGRILAQLKRQNKLSIKENLESLNLKKALSFVVQAYQDLGQQMQEAWQRGSLTSTLVKLEVQGGLPINKYDLFKDSLKSANRSIRQVRERLISSQSVIFEIEFNGVVSDLTASLSQVTAGDRTYHFKGLNSSNTLILSTEAK